MYHNQQEGSSQEKGPCKRRSSVASYMIRQPHCTTFWCKEPKNTKSATTSKHYPDDNDSYNLTVHLTIHFAAQGVFLHIITIVPNMWHQR
jgi:hypothetical protein